MKIYQIIKLYSRIKSKRLKLFALWLFHVVGKRYLCIFFDPVLACNLRCKMCYFSDPVYRKKLHGVVSDEEVEAMAAALFHRVVKLQIGCGAEPTLYPKLPQVIRLAKQHRVPFVSVTTNGNLLDQAQLTALVEAGLDELTISCHGIHRTTYEALMTGAHFDAFLRLLQAIRAVREQHPALKVRVNYTMNSDNTAELADFFDLFHDVPLDVLQLRPIQQIGDSEYHDFSHQRIAQLMDTVVQPLVQQCKHKGIVCLVPELQHLHNLDVDAPDDDKVFKDFVYGNWSPSAHFREGFDPQHESFEQYAHRHHTGWRIWCSIFKLHPDNHALGNGQRTRKANYTVK